jgi:hypothetical protein
MKVVKTAFVVAIPVEIANLFMAMAPLDTGFAPGDPWSDKVLGYEWLVMHYPGVILAAWLDDTGFEKWLVARINWMSSATLDESIFFLCGYIDTALLILAVILALRWWVRRPEGRHPEAQN